MTPKEPLQIIATRNAPAAIGPYSQAACSGNLLFVSGQLGLVPETGSFAGADLPAQARQALANVRSIVEAAGGRLEDILAVDVYLTDMSLFVAFNEIYEEFFQNHKPARAVVEVSGLPKGGLIEIKCMASVG